MTQGHEHCASRLEDHSDGPAGLHRAHNGQRLLPPSAWRAIMCAVIVCLGGVINMFGRTSLLVPRTFAYDSLSRLKDATNPESGLTSYTYYDSGNLKTRTDARNITTTMYCDTENRLTSKTYSDGATPTVTYTWDTGTNCLKRFLCGVQSGSSSYAASYQYNLLGQTTAVTQTTAGTPYPPSNYIYDLQGNVKQITYPSGRVVSYTLGSAGRATAAGVPAVAGAYASSITYAPHGALSGMTMGNGVVESLTFDARLHAGTITAAKSNSQLLAITNGYAANGNVSTQTITLNSSPYYTQTFGYDSANRLTSAWEQNSGVGAYLWFQYYNYDQYGNRALSSSFTGPLDAATSTSQYVNPNTGATANRYVYASDNSLMPSDAYDGAGNLKHHPKTGQFTFDAENRMITATLTGSPTTTYTYDGEGRRVSAVTAGGQTTIFVYGADGQLLAEYGNTSSARTRYLTVDALGSTRLVTDAAGTVASRHDYAPFGEELPTVSNSSVRTAANNFIGQEPGVRQAFTGKERDSESGLDYFEARYLSAAQGRFTSVDPNISLGLHLDDPQSWNGYAYARNNPLLYTDPDGRDYRVCQVDQNGKESNCGVVQDEKAFEGYAKSQGWQVKGGTIYDSSGNSVGAAHWFDGDSMRALIRGTQMAEPGVNLAGQGLMLFGSFVAPLPMALAQYAAGGGSNTDVAMAMLPEISGLYEGGQILKAAAAAGKKGAEIVRKAGGVTQAMRDFEALGGSETIKGATRIRTLSDGTKAILYTSSSGAEPTIQIQHATGTVSKFRY